MVLELPQPTVIRRAVAFGAAMFEGLVEIEGIIGRRVDELEGTEDSFGKGEVPVMADPEGKVISEWSPEVLVDAILAKKNLDTKITDAPIVIGLGPGFEAGVDVHAVVETQRGHYLGRVILEGTAAPDTGIPGAVMGYTVERVLRAPCAGVFEAKRQIGDAAKEGEVVGYVNGTPVVAAISGVIRGVIADGLMVREGLKVGDIDPGGIREHCFTISDKALAIGGGVLEAILYLRRKLSG
jgi:xanthine dehydrogenase accessory factor